jgi:hypothetical protein
MVFLPEHSAELVSEPEHQEESVEPPASLMVAASKLRVSASEHPGDAEVFAQSATLVETAKNQAWTVGAVWEPEPAPEHQAEVEKRQRMSYSEMEEQG